MLLYDWCGDCDNLMRLFLIVEEDIFAFGHPDPGTWGAPVALQQLPLCQCHATMPTRWLKVWDYGNIFPKGYQVARYIRKTPNLLFILFRTFHTFCK